MPSPAPPPAETDPEPELLPLPDAPTTAPDEALAPVLEALLFAAPRPLTARELAGLLRAAAESEPEHFGAAALGAKREGEIHAVLVALRVRWAAEGRGVRLDDTAAGWQMTTAPGCGAWVRELFPGERPARLSPAALETLAVIAYRQPIARSEVEAVRGVAVDGIVQTLLDRGLLRITGRSDSPGRPILYGTTDFFLEHFALRDLAELPNAEELKRMVLPRPPAPAGGNPTRSGEPEPPGHPETAADGIRSGPLG